MENAVSCSNAPFPFFFSVKLETNSAASKLMTDHWSDVNNFVSYSSVLVSSTQRNIVLPCKLRIPESKLLALFKPLRITFFHENSHFVVFRSFKTSCSKQQLWLAVPALAASWPPYCFDSNDKPHAIEACMFLKCDVNRKNRSRNLNAVPHGPSNNQIT